MVVGGIVSRRPGGPGTRERRGNGPVGSADTGGADVLGTVLAAGWPAPRETHRQAREKENDVELGLLILRMMLAILLAGHSLQKLAGWFHGGGVRGTAPLFAAWGHQPAAPLVVTAGVLESVAAVLLAAGLCTPLAGAIVGGTMLVAGSVNAEKGLWAVRGGYELPLVYGIVALALAFTGPGDWALDAVVDLPAEAGVTWGVVATVLAAVAGTAVSARARYVLRRDVHDSEIRGGVS
jgi:putative oxidoreductase